MTTVDTSTFDVSHKYLVLDVTTAAATALQTTLFDVGSRIVEVLDVFWPPGANGLVGLRVNFAGVTLLPWNQPARFLVGNGERRRFEFALPVDAPLQVVTQNNDPAFQHTIVITADLIERPSDLVAAATPLLPLMSETL